MFLALTFLLAMEILTGSGTGPPNVAGYTPVLSKELDFQVDDYITCFVGRMVVYQNPNNQKESVKVFYRQVAICSERPKERNSSETNGRDTNLSNLNYLRNKEAEVLGRVQQATDAFAYVQWQTVRDPRTGQEIQDGFFKSWLLGQDGNWAFSSTDELFPVPFSELSKVNPQKRINVGIMFSLNDVIHIVRIDQDEMIVLPKEATDEKK